MDWDITITHIHWCHAGTWGLPGGHLEANESFEDCANREILEETGLQIRNLRFLTATNDIMESEGKHYVTIFMGGVCSDDTAQPQVCVAHHVAFVYPLCPAGNLLLIIYPSRSLNHISVRLGNGSPGMRCVQMEKRNCVPRILKDGRCSHLC